MLIAHGNGEELHHLYHQEDWLKTAVISPKDFKHNGMPMTLYIV